MLDVVEYGYGWSVGKHIHHVQQGILDCLVACQHHHLLKPEMDGEHRAIFL